jgi:hypothetical protein
VLCITLRRNGHYQGARCGPIPRSPQRALLIFPDAFTDTYAAAVPASVRFAEVEGPRGQRIRHRTFAAPGFVSRFVLIPPPPSAVFVRYYGADGTLLGIDPGPLGYISQENETPVAKGVSAYTEPSLYPTPDDPDRLLTIHCVDVANATGQSGFGVCDGFADNGVALSAACELPNMVGGVLGHDVAGMRLTLGSGAALTLPARDLPSLFGGSRAFAGSVPDGEAVRAAAAVDAAGAVVARIAVGAAPGAQPCRSGFDGSFARLLAPASPPADAVTVAAASGESLLAADEGERLCVGFARLAARTCPAAPIDSDQPRLLRRGRAVGGALGRDAARVTLRLDGGRRVTVETTDGPAYTGHWAGDVRFFAATVPARRKVIGAVVRDAAGTIVGVNRRGIRIRATHHRILAKRGGIGVEMVRRTGGPPCLRAFATDAPPVPEFCTDPHPGQQIDGPPIPYSGSITVACAPRRAVVYGRMPDRLDPPVVRLAGGKTVRSRRIRLRGEDAWVAFLPDAGIRGLRSGSAAARVRLPPAGEQCGYSTEHHF